METKNKIYLIAASALATIIFILAGLLVFLKPKPPADSNQNVNADINDTVNSSRQLPFSKSIFPDGAGNGNGEVVPKERKMFADYYEMEKLYFSPGTAVYQVPLNIKTDVINYRDMSRKLNLDPIQNNLENYGFTVIPYPFEQNDNFEQIYETLNENEIPVFVTADTISYANLLQQQILFKEIEQDVFYSSMWRVTKRLYERSRSRFDRQRQGQSIASNVMLEAARTETAFFAAVLEILRPKQNQIKEEWVTSGLGKKYFSELESSYFTFEMPELLKNQINNEISLINKHNSITKSPIFLYPIDYSKFSPSSAYSSSEKLKNYSLAAKLYSEILLPLYSVDDSCPQCLLDTDDQRILFVASNLIAQDFRDDKESRNEWLKIYKTLSFFKGLEYDFTYLHYLDALISLFGEEFDAEKLFSPDNPEFERNVYLVQNKLETYTSMEIEGSQKEKHKKGLKLLRSPFSAENYLFVNLITPAVSDYLGDAGDKNLPKTACLLDSKTVRCLPRTLDILSLLGSQESSQIISAEKDDLYSGYDEILAQLKNKISTFDKYTWYGNIFWTTLKDINPYLNLNDSGYPTFMSNSLWQKKNLNMVLASRLALRKDVSINFENKKTDPNKMLATESDYGFLEPAPEFYNNLIAENKMIKNAFIDLEIIPKNDPIIERLDNNIEVLSQSLIISLKELENIPLDDEEKLFINEFYKQLNLLSGNLTPGSLSLKFSAISFTSPEGKKLQEEISGANLILAIYQTPNGEKVLIAGPVFNYYEIIGTKSYAPWQKEFIIQ
ncbi:DUF3160 domain-containing protein [Candidatus Parcubacteria bacterium]|nr:MAG: DUF3160 domain-containing protein [Candidatus Parcubacteria bacterium]